MEVLAMEHPHTPHSPSRHLFYSTPSSPRSDDVFEFNFSGHLVGPTLPAADELFHCGKILPLAPPPVIQSKPHVQTPSRPRSRPRTTRRGMSRSLSPLRVSEFALLQNQQHQQQHQPNTSSSLWGSKKWRFKDLFLFRSASEGSSGPLKILYPHHTASISSSSSASSASVRSAIDSGSGSGSSRRKSSHEMHYAPNRAVSGELNKKTSLPYRYGLLGCLGLHLSSCPCTS